MVVAAARILGYVNRGRRDIALGALPLGVSLTQCGQPPEQIAAKRGGKWPTIAVRRCMIYRVFLHELGHLQLMKEDARSAALKFARGKAAAFAVKWAKRLWSEPFHHPDPVHHAPTVAEIAVEAETSGYQI